MSTTKTTPDDRIVMTRECLRCGFAIPVTAKDVLTKRWQHKPCPSCGRRPLPA
jgi:hypothetical protein